MDFIPLATIITYFAVVTGVGTAMARRSQSAAGWAVAGGSMSTVMVAVGVTGTRVGGAGTYGVAGDVITGGVWNFWWYGINIFLALSLVGVLFAVYYRRLKLHTVGELFTIRWGARRCQWLTSLCVQTECAVVNLIEAYVIGVILSALTPLSRLGGTMVARGLLLDLRLVGRSLGHRPHQSNPLRGGLHRTLHRQCHGGRSTRRLGRSPVQSGTISRRPVGVKPHGGTSSAPVGCRSWRCSSPQPFTPRPPRSTRISRPRHEPNGRSSRPLSWAAPSPDSCRCWPE